MSGCTWKRVARCGIVNVVPVGAAPPRPTSLTTCAPLLSVRAGARGLASDQWSDRWRRRTLQRVTAADTGAIAFAEKLLTLLEDGRFTSTYKYAVLLALLNLCLEQTSASGAAPTTITTPQLARKVVELYWPQTKPFEAATAPVLTQNTRGQAEIVSRIVDFRRKHGGVGSAWQARAQHAAAYDALVRFVEWKLVEMPLWRLQRLGDTELPVLYRVGWGEEIKRSMLDSPSFDNRILLLAGVGEHLVRLSGLLRPLVQRQWAAKVAEVNRDVIPDAKLDEHLFGASRVSLDMVRGPLVELQGNACFYCGERLKDRVEIDHFLPWSRYGSDDLENLVAAHGRCNGDKRDFMASAAHVQTWADRARREAASLAVIAVDARWTYAPGTPLAVARAVYLRLPEDGRLWSVGKTFVPVDRVGLVRALAA